HQLVDDKSDLTKLWDQEHDMYVAKVLLNAVVPAFQQNTWQAFWQTTILERPAAEVATELKITENAVFIARHRVMQRLRDEARGLLDE
ncbi:MAG: RNA polymerase sigma factor, partial [Gemmataceae bacterium]